MTRNLAVLILLLLAACAPPRHASSPASFRDPGLDSLLAASVLEQVREIMTRLPPDSITWAWKVTAPGLSPARAAWLERGLRDFARPTAGVDDARLLRIVTVEPVDTAGEMAGAIVRLGGRWRGEDGHPPNGWTHRFVRGDRGWRLLDRRLARGEPSRLLVAEPTPRLPLTRNLSPGERRALRSPPLGAALAAAVAEHARDEFRPSPADTAAWAWQLDLGGLPPRDAMRLGAELRLLGRPTADSASARLLRLLTVEAPVVEGDSATARVVVGWRWRCSPGRWLGNSTGYDYRLVRRDGLGWRLVGRRTVMHGDSPPCPPPLPRMPG